ncbi:MAG: tetratricopeptide repeat protein [bacterium]
MNKSNTALTVTLPIIVCCIVMAGCSVFEPIGGFFASGYENTVSYFNAYYNAKKAFDEAEKEITAQARSPKNKTTELAQPGRISETAKANLTKVIDKCSHILSFYQSSAVADDALLLIGKSYFYQADYIKAERKFSELVAKYPDSPLLFESQLWFLKTLEKMNRLDDAIRAGEMLATSALEADEQSIAGEAYFTMASIELAKENSKGAEEYFQKALEVSGDDFIKGSAQSRIGDLNYERGEYEKAASAYLKVSELTSDVYLNYYSRLQAVIAFRTLKRYDTSMLLLDEMKDDYRFNEFFGMIHFERGNTCALQKELDRAIAEYEYVDTTYARTEVGAKASFELAKLLQYSLGNYQEAKLVYDRAAMNAAFVSAPIAAKRALALAKYFDFKNQMHNLDSLKKLPEIASAAPLKQDSSTTERMPDSSVVPSGKIAKADSLLQKHDSTKVVVSKDSVTVKTDSVRLQPVRLGKDSIKTMHARLAYDLGELFYAELDSPDSASYWLTEAYNTSRDTMRTPRALFVLAELARTDSVRFGKPRDYYDRLFNDYPKSSYADRAQIILGLKSAESTKDSAEYYYTRGSLLMESGKYKESILTFDSLQSKYPSSPFVPKSSYTKAWIYENYLKQPDSAITYYKFVSEKFSNSPFATAAKRRVPDPEKKISPPDTLKKESSVPADSLKKPNRAIPEDVDDKKPPDNQLKKAAADSSAVRRENRI